MIITWKIDWNDFYHKNAFKKERKENKRQRGTISKSAKAIIFARDSTDIHIFFTIKCIGNDFYWKNPSKIIFTIKCVGNDIYYKNALNKHLYNKNFTIKKCWKWFFCKITLKILFTRNGIGNDYFIVKMY